MRTLLGGSERPPDSAAIGLPGARYTAAKMTKLATSRLTSSMASLRAKKRQRIASAGPLRPAEAVGPGREHVGERRHRPGQLAAEHQQLRRLDVRDPRQLLQGERLRPHHE